MAAKRKKKVAYPTSTARNKPTPTHPAALEAMIHGDEGELGEHHIGAENPLASRVTELEGALERVNKTLIGRNDELDAARQVAEREVFKDVVVMAAMLDAKAYIASRGGIEGAVIVQRIAIVESRLGVKATEAAVVLQKIKTLVAAQQGGREIFPEDFDDILKAAERL